LKKLDKPFPVKAGWEKFNKLTADIDTKEEINASFLVQHTTLENALWALQSRKEYSLLWRKYVIWCLWENKDLSINPDFEKHLKELWEYCAQPMSKNSLPPIRKRIKESLTLNKKNKYSYMDTALLLAASRDISIYAPYEIIKNIIFASTKSKTELINIFTTKLKLVLDTSNCICSIQETLI